MKRLLAGLKIYYEQRRNVKRSLNELKARQWSSFVDLVRYSYQYVPFYRNLYDKAGFSPLDLKTPSDLTSVPKTHKVMFQEIDPKQRIAEGYHPDNLVCKTTSGSSGVPLYVCYTPEDRIYRTILHLRILFHNGMGFRDRMAQITYRRIPDYNYFFQKIGFLPKEFVYLPANPPEKQLDQLTDIDPSVLYAYASSMVLLSAEVKRRGHCPINPKLIFTTGELLSQADRMLIDSAFNVRLRDIYGSVEMGDVAWQCPKLEGYHLNVDSFLAEIEAEGRPAEPGEAGRLVITNLHSRSMPFIRYDLGDVLIAPREDPCSCGCTFPRIGVIQGRVDDWLYSTDGKKVSPLVFLICSIPGVQQYRMIQKAYDSLLVEILPGPDFSDETLKKVKEHVLERMGVMGSGMKVDVYKVEHLPQQSGKMRRIISEIMV